MIDVRIGIAWSIVALVAASGCSSDDEESESRRVAAPVALVADAPDDPVVAEVAGRPVRASCVVAQARAAGGGVQEALSACIGFELLAKRAEELGYAERPEVIEARKREAARVLMTEEFAADFAEPADVPHAHLEELWPQARRRFDHPEHRFTVYVRAPFPEDAEPGSDAEQNARALAEEIYREMRDLEGLDETRFAALAREIAGDRAIERGEPFDFSRHGRADESFAEAAFAIEEVGAVSPPTRTPWGWDVILLTRVEPETRKGFEEALPRLRELVFEPSRRRAFLEWVDEISGAFRIEVHAENLDRLAELGDPLGAAP